MRDVDIKLKDWHRLHLELGSVEQLLADPVLSKAHQRSDVLLARAAVLRQDAEVAFQALNVALKATRESRYAPKPAGSSNCPTHP